MPDVGNPKYKEQERVYGRNNGEVSCACRPRGGRVFWGFLSMQAWAGLKSHQSWSKAEGLQKLLRG